MSEDAERRKRERKAKVSGDPGEAAAVERDQARVGAGVLGFLDELVGKRVFVEGARINYRGTLREVLRDGSGLPAGLVLQPCQRVSWFQRNGPENAWTYTHTKPRLVPYEMVHDVGEEGFVEGTWPELRGS